MRKVEDKTAELVASAAIETIATRQGSCADHQTVAKTLECNYTILLLRTPVGHWTEEGTSMV